MLIPGDQLPLVCPRRLLAAIVTELHKKGMITDDIALPEKDRTCSCTQTSASWLGICHVPGVLEQSCTSTAGSDPLQ